MRCSACHKSNIEDQKLCVFCGNLLAPACSWCGFSNAPEDVFCRGCKAALSEAASTVETETWRPQFLANGRYRTFRVLGDSGAGQVYLAHDLTLDRQVAITMVAVAGLGDTGRLRVMGLARSMAALSGHFRIVGIYEASEQDGHPYLVSEYPGSSLQEILAGAGDHRLPLLDALRICEGICEALQHAHSAGIVHGGLSPAAVFLTRDGSCKVGAFGFGLPLAMELSELAGEIVSFGSAGYLAPEQIGAREANQQADLYALGAILYEAVTGVTPLGDAGAVDLATQLSRKPMPPSWRRPEIPRALDNLVHNLLRKSPQSRPQSASVVLDQIRSIIAILEQPAVMPSPARRADAPAPELAAGHDISGSGAIASPLWRVTDLLQPTQLLFASVGAVTILAIISLVLLGRRGTMLELAKIDHRVSQVSRGAAPATQGSGRTGNRDNAKPPQSAADAKPQPYPELIELANQGDLAAQTALGNIYLHGEGVAKDYAQALHWLQLGASHGDAEAETSLGYMYASGYGVTPDYREAARWFAEAAAHNDPDAQYDLALIYENGRGVPIDRIEALRWFRNAAAHDNPRAQYELGRRYLEGDGVTQDYGRALQWLGKAAEQGNVGAQNALGYMYEQARGVLRDYVQALNWYKKAAGQGDAKAELNLGIMYEAGEGVAQDYAQALQWYRKAADQGVAYAQTSIGVMYCKGEGVKQDYNQALQWFSRAAEQDEPKAQYNLGIMYDTGLGVPTDRAQAARWYRKAAAQGDVDAQYNLGYLYEHGEGVAKNYVEALQWYRKAAGHGDNTALKRVKDLEAPGGAGGADHSQKKSATDDQAPEESN